jgi:hypothetical protein
VRRNSSPTSVNVESDSPTVETGHQSVKRAVMRINRKSDAMIAASWLLWLRKKCAFGSVVTANRPVTRIDGPDENRAVKGEHHFVTHEDGQRELVDPFHATSNSAHSTSLKQRKTTTRNVGTPGLLS